MPRKKLGCLLHGLPQCAECGHPTPRGRPKRWPKSRPRPNQWRDAYAFVLKMRRLGWKTIAQRLGWTLEDDSETLRRAVNRLPVTGVLTADDPSIPETFRPRKGEAIVFIGDHDDMEVVPNDR